MKLLHSLPAITLFAAQTLASCGQQPPAPAATAANKATTSSSKVATASGKAATSSHFTEGKDYQVFERLRLLDKVGFTEPQEAYSMLLPKGWQHQDQIIWNTPGTSCAGTFNRLSAKSPDGRYRFDIFPDAVFMWNTNPQLMQFYRQNGSGYGQDNSNCTTHEPVNAEAYLRNVFVQEIGHPQIIKVEENAGVVAGMQRENARAMSELRQYGAASVQFHQTAVNAEVKWNDGSVGLVTVGVTVVETDVPNVYNGTSDKIYTTQASKRTVFKFPADDAEKAKNQFSVIMSSIRTNPAWADAVNTFWRNARQQSHIAHVGKIRLMDEQTRRIGEQAIRNGQQRLRDMDNDMRTWEKQQASQDYMHTEFVKTIREVENYRDETGKYEMSAGYDHVWSRGDGNSFILSNSSTFDPAAVFQDQNWKEMKKVH